MTGRGSGDFISLTQYSKRAFPLIDPEADLSELTRRFLEYSLRHRRPVKLVWVAEGEIKAGNVTVLRLGDEDFDYLTARGKKKALTMGISGVLSASYARGDDGNTMKNQEREGREGG